MASATMMSCPHHKREQPHATRLNVALTAEAAAHQHCQQHQDHDQDRRHSGGDTVCTCLGPCAGGLATMPYIQYATDSDLVRHWSASALTLATLAKPLTPFRPPISFAT